MAGDFCVVVTAVTCSGNGRAIPLRPMRNGSPHVCGQITRCKSRVRAEKRSKEPSTSAQQQDVPPAAQRPGVADTAPTPEKRRQDAGQGR